MRQRSNIVLIIFGIFLLGGCTTTKVNLYEYKDVSSVAIIDEEKADYKVIHPKLNPDILIETNGWNDLELSMRDYFLAYNDTMKIFNLDENGSYQLKLTLHNVSSSQKYNPPRYIEKKRKVKTDKGIVIKDESYYTTPYWRYTVETSAVAELMTSNGGRKFFESSDMSSFSVNGRYRSDIPRSRYIDSLENTLVGLLKQMANDMAPDGLVVSKKVSIGDDEDFIFMVNIGEAEGLYEGQKVQLFKEIVFKDEINAKTVTNKVRIGSAKVSDQITAHYAWVIMDDSEHSRMIEVGDIVRPLY